MFYNVYKYQERSKKCINWSDIKSRWDEKRKRISIVRCTRIIEGTKISEKQRNTGRKPSEYTRCSGSFGSTKLSNEQIPRANDINWITYYRCWRYRAMEAHFAEQALFNLNLIRLPSSNRTIVHRGHWFGCIIRVSNCAFIAKCFRF